MGEIENYREKLEQIRKEIDKIDDNIVDLLNNRGELVLKIGKIKKEHNLKTKQSNREIEIMKRIQSRSTFYKKSISAIWKKIIKASRKIQG
ncbi:MAG: chorismate mutase [Candidatus Hodarchaeota archaeon]